MTQFAIFATLLIVVVAAFILPPLWLGLRAPKDKASRKEANTAIFRDQLKELETEKTEGMLADADFEQARRELQRRLLEDVEPDAAASPARPCATCSTNRKPVTAVHGTCSPASFSRPRRPASCRCGIAGRCCTSGRPARGPSAGVGMKVQYDRNTNAARPATIRTA